MAQLTIKDFRMDYHRNGIGGQGGYWCCFTEDGTQFAGWLWHSCARHYDGLCESGDLPNEATVVALTHLSGFAGGEKELPAWRSTDNYLPAILPHFSRAYNAWLARPVAYAARGAVTVSQEDAK